VRVFCQDESRIGLRLPSYRRITSFGVKPREQVNPLYEYYWLYGAVEPATGESFFLEMPRLDHVCFSVYLSELGKKYRKSLNVVIVDNAPAHIAKKLVVPENVVLLFLPPYSPELNPVERLWLDLKRSIKTEIKAVRSGLTALRDHVAEIIRGYTKQDLRSLTGYAYVLDAATQL
jgi:transposase